MQQDSPTALATPLSNDSAFPRLSVAETQPVAPEPVRQGLFDRRVDFWLMGGASCVVWLLMTVFSHFRDISSIDRHFGNIAAFSGLMVLFVNYPHFMLSYKIAYGRGQKFIARHWIQLIFVPLALTTLIAASYATFFDASPLSKEWNPTRVAKGEGLFSLLIMFMFFTVGWHYVKQTFGCMMVYGSLDQYRLSARARKILLGTLYIVWYANLIGAHVGEVSKSDFYGIPLYSLGLPFAIRVILDSSFWIALGLFAYFGPLRIWRETRRLPSLNFLIPLIALIIWWNPLFQQRDFYFLLVPLFHSLQYLPFAAKYEMNRIKDKPKHWLLGGTAIVFYMIVTGWLAFELIPGFGPALQDSAGPTKVLFFVAASHVFINIHHYFIDSVIWRFHHPEVQRYLLGRTS